MRLRVTGCELQVDLFPASRETFEKCSILVKIKEGKTSLDFA